MHLHLTPSNIPSTQTTQPNHKPTKSNLTDQMKTVSKKTTIPNKENITVPNKENIYPQPVNQQIKHRPTISLHEIQKNEPSLTIVNNMSIEEKELKKHLIKLMPDKNPALLINKFIEHLAKQQMTDLKIYDEEPKTLDRNEHYLKEYESEIIKKMHQDEVKSILSF